MKMRVCFFGSYEKDSFGIPSGNSGTLLKKILESQKVEVVECHQPLKNVTSFLSSYIKLFLQHRKIEYDVMMIPWRGVLTLPLAKLVHKKPIIYFPAFSIYDTLVNDRKKIRKNSLKAKFVHFVDKTACNWSDMIIVESFEEIKYFVKEFGLAKKKFRQYPLAADESIFYPQASMKNPNEKFIVLFFGSFIPLHGIEIIVKSAKILRKSEDIIFRICGEGQTKTEIKKLIEKNDLNSVKLLGFVSKETLIENIHSSDICLGIFGKTEKAKKVVTNKVFQILASKKPLITMESPASLEAHLEDKVNCLLVLPSSPEKLAEAILFLKNDPKQRCKLEDAGYDTYLKHLSIDSVGKKLVGYIDELLGR